MGQKICCGGFNLGEGLELDGRTLKATGGSGLPDPSVLSDGTTMVAVNGEWKMQEGYGYIGDPAFEPITWDGDTEERDAIELGGTPALWKVSDAVLTGEMFSGAKARDNIGAISGVVVILSSDGFVYAEAELIGKAIISGVQGEYSAGGGTVTVPSDGTYFMESGNDYLAELATPSVHQFDSALIPSGDYTVTFSLGDDGETYTCDKTLDEILANSNNAKFVLLLEGAILHAISEMVEPSMPLVYAVFNILANDKLQNYVITYNEDGVSGSSASYTLTPDT